MTDEEYSKIAAQIAEALDATTEIVWDGRSVAYAEPLGVGSIGGNEMTSRTLVAIGLAVLALIFVCTMMASGFTDTVDGFLLDEDAARSERLRLVDAEQQRQETKEAQARAEEAARQVEIERERAAQEEAKERQREYEVEWQRAYGERVRDEAAAYTTKRMADASYKAIQRQGHLLALSHLQYIFFGGVVMAGLVFGSLGALAWYSDRIVKKGAK